MITTSPSQHRVESDSATPFRRDEMVPTGQASSLESIQATRDAPVRRNVVLPPRLLPILPTMLGIVDLELVGKNWDGHDGRPATLKAIGVALEVFGSHPRILLAPLIAPRSDGGVHLEWTSPASIELDVEPDGVITLLIAEGDDWLDFEFDSAGDPELHELLTPVQS